MGSERLERSRSLETAEFQGEAAREHAHAAIEPRCCECLRQFDG
jgi:hypothetical protein